MAKRRARRKPKIVTPEVETIVEEELDIDDEEVEEVPPVKKTTRRRRRKPAPKPVEEIVEEELDIEEEDEFDDEEDAPEPPKKPARRRRTGSKRKSVVPVADVISTDQADKIGQASPKELAEAIFDLLDLGIVVSLRKVGEHYIIYEGAPVEDVAKSRAGKRVRAISGKEFESIAYSEEFKAFHPMWNKFSYEEKVAKAEEEGVEWERHETAKVDVMRLTTAYRIHSGVEKWAPDYVDGKIRKVLRNEGQVAAEALIAKFAAIDGPFDDEEVGEEVEEVPPVKKTTRRRRT